jgi:hypothetical protein
VSIITSEAFARRLVDLGIIEDTDCVRRLVIDAQVGEALKVHVEYYGDERWLDVVPTLDGVEVHTRRQGGGGV